MIYFARHMGAKTVGQKFCHSFSSHFVNYLAFCPGLESTKSSPLLIFIGNQVDWYPVQ